MSRGRTPRPSQSRIPSKKPSIARAVDHVQFLEKRELLTTLSATAADGPTEFNYLDASESAVRITLIGDITAEFTAGRVQEIDRDRGVTNRVVLRDLIPAFPPPTPNPTEGADLFNIYIAEAAPDAIITITSVPNAGSPDRDATPYGGSVGTIRADDGDPGTNSPTESITPDGTGDVYIGARTINVNGATPTLAGFPITVVRNRQAFGVRPAARAVYAGIQTASGVSMGRVMIGGTVTGIVNMGGNVETFYAGNILTGSGGLGAGDRIGLQQGATPEIANSFQVAGDLQNLIVLGSVGGTTANTQFRAGTQVLIRGRLGSVRVGGNWVASLSVLAGSNLSIDTPQVEAEYKLQPGENDALVFVSGLLGPASGSGNDDEANAVFAATGQGANDGNMRWSGIIQDGPGTDPGDNYNLPLLAGQRATIQLVPYTVTVDTDGRQTLTALPGAASLQVIDPLGRVTASDAQLNVSTTGLSDQFQIVADLPGIYRLQVTAANSDVPYFLYANAVGNVTVGGGNVAGNTRLRETANGIALRTGDLGGWFTQGDMSGYTASYQGVASPIALSRGNLRSLYTGGEMGVELINNTAELIQLSVPRGSVGYLRSGLAVAINPDSVFAGGDPNVAFAIGGDYQRVQAGENLDSNLIANGRIGTLVAEDINGDNVADRPGDVPTFQPVFSANTDGNGRDGTIDMIYVSDDVGNQPRGATGPAIYTGLNGNVKYFYVGDVVFRDGFFGSPFATSQTYTPGRSVNFTDDSGATAIITPVQVTNQLNGNGIGTGTGPVADFGNTAPVGSVDVGSRSTSLNPDDLVAQDGTLTLTTYAVRGGAGLVLIRAQSSTSMTVTTTSGAGGSVDIADMVTGSTGSPVQQAAIVPTGNPSAFPINAVGFGATLVTDGTNGGGGTGTGTGPLGAVVPLPGIRQNTTLRTLPIRRNDITMNGVFPVNVMQISGNDVTNLTNTTRGEIGSGNFDSVGNINARTLGRITGASVTRPEIVSNIATTPGDLTINPLGNAPENPFSFNPFARAIDIDTSVIAVTARDGIGSVSAGDTVGVINANSDGRNVRGVFDGIDGVVVGQVINNVQIGEGVGFGGTGNFFKTAIYATDRLVNLAGQNADIRGPVVANNSAESIILNDGSIIGTTVGVFPNISATRFTDPVVPTVIEFTGGLTFDLVTLRINGNGGVIGSSIATGNFGNITIGGFGIITSAISTASRSRVNGTLSVGGLGIRLTSVQLGSTINTIAATGDGRVLDVNQFSASVRQTGGRRRLRFDPNSGRLLDASLDLNRLLGTSPTNGRIRGVTNSGVVQDSFFVGNGDLTNFQAYAVTSTDTETFVGSVLFPSQLVFANSIGTMNVLNGISGLQMRAGDFGTLNVGGSMARVQFEVAGRLDSVNVGKTVRGTVTINANGEGGNIGDIIVGGNLFGFIGANLGIVSIAADVLGANIATSRGIGRIGVNDDVLAGTVIRARDDIGRVIIGGDFQAGAVIDADDIGVFRVGGANNGIVR